MLANDRDSPTRRASSMHGRLLLALVLCHLLQSSGNDVDIHELCRPRGSSGWQISTWTARLLPTRSARRLSFSFQRSKSAGHSSASRSTHMSLSFGLLGERTSIMASHMLLYSAAAVCKQTQACMHVCTHKRHVQIIVILVLNMHIKTALIVHPCEI